MIKLTNDASGEAGNTLYISAESIEAIRPWDGSTRIDVRSKSYFVTEFPEEVTRKILLYKLALRDYESSGTFDNNAANTAMLALMVLAGLEE